MKKRVLIPTVVGLVIGTMLAVSVTLARDTEHERDSGLSCSVTVPDPEPTDLASLAKITPEEAKVKALTGQPDGTIVIEVELENEYRCLIYEVSLSNGFEVSIDAGNGKVLQVEPAD